MIEKTGNNKTYLEPEVEDVMNAIDLGKDHIITDWPWGRKQTCSMHFSVEATKRGQRFVKQSTMAGHTYKPKRGTYYANVQLIEIDGKMGHVSWHSGYGMLGVNVEDGRYISKTFYEKDAEKLAHHFGFV